MVMNAVLVVALFWTEEVTAALNARRRDNGQKTNGALP